MSFNTINISYWPATNHFSGFVSFPYNSNTENASIVINNPATLDCAVLIASQAFIDAANAAIIQKKNSIDNPVIF